MTKQLTTITAGTNISWQLGLADDPDVQAPEGFPPELAALITGRFGLYVLAVPEYGIAITMKRSEWDPAMEADGIAVPSDEAAVILRTGSLNQWLDGTEAVNALSAVPITHTIGVGTITVHKDLGVYSFPEEATPEAITALADRIKACEEAGQLVE